MLTFDPVTQTLSASGYYPQNYFTVSVTAGPDGSLTETWTDEFGTPVLERVRIQEAAYLNEEDDWAETRYVKDVRGRVLCVIPPAEYDQLLTAANNNGIVSSFSAEHCYTYKYDGRDRVVKRHLPDKAMETLSYNNADLVTLTVRTAADGIGTETFTTIYDDHNRPTKETYQYGNATAITLARYAYDSKRDTLKVGGIVHSVPKFSEVAGIVTAADRDSLTLRGQKTAELVRIVSPGETPATMATNANAQFIVRSFHYDKKDNVIQTVEKRPDVNATVRTSTKYGFAGNVLQSKETVDIPASGNGSAITGNLNKAFTYDALLRPTGETSQLTSGGTTGPEGILNYTYDDFGRPSTLTRGSGTTDATTYSYTLQGWLQNASSPNYEETLRYASPSRTATDALPGKAGLVTEWTFRQKGTTANGAMSSSNTYAYTYDGAGRLLGSVRYSGSSTSKLSTLTEKNISYDHSGNLLALKRYGSSSGTTPVNNYTFTYTGTKRSGYTYDAHGNVTADPTNGTSIQWNVLGLPKSISDGTDSARRVYATDGTLLAVYEGTAGTTGKVYLGPMVYDRNATGTLSLESAGWEGGRILSGTGNDKLIYQITDHLGSVRVIKDGEGTVLQRFDYYPFGSESRVWTAGTNTPQSALRYRFGGKEIAGKKVSVSTGAPAAAAGSPYLDFGARVYDPRTAAWLAPDPLSEKYYGISPYSYAGDCPISIIDPNGRDIYLFGDLIEEAFKQLQDGMQGRISLSMDDSGKLSYSLIDGQKLKGNAKRMAKMIDDHSITVNLFTTDKDKTSTGNLMVGGAFMGNTVHDDGNGRRTVEARQEINPNVLGSADAHTRTPGKMIMHEVTEAYAGAEISMRSGKNAAPASGADENNPQSVYMRAHKKATPQTIVGQHLYDSKGNLLENSVSNLPRASRVEWYVTHRGRELILQRLP